MHGLKENAQKLYAKYLKYGTAPVTKVSDDIKANCTEIE
jgi:hypothetical protein